LVNFTEAKELFRDVVDVNNYIPLPSSEAVKNDLLNAINQKEKMIILTGKAGSGKSLLLKSIYEELKEREKIFFVSNPYLEINSMLEIINNLNQDSHYILLLDEAQLLTAEIWENLRIYSDRGNITIVFATHDTDIKHLLEKKHFKTRINYIISTKTPSKNEIENFILTKLLRHNFNDIATMFSKSNFRLIYRFTKGSLRATNQLIYKLFDVMDYFYNTYPHKFNLRKIENKYIHIAIMDLKVINA